MSNLFNEVLKARRYAIAISLVLLLLGLGGVVYQGGLLYGIDFTGGMKMMFEFSEPIETERMSDIRNSLNEIETTIRVKTFTFEGEQQRRGLMLTVRTQHFVDRITDILIDQSGTSAGDFFDQIMTYDSIQLIGIEEFRKNFRLGEGESENINLREASRDRVRNRVQTIVNEGLSSRIVSRLRELQGSPESIDLNWATNDEISQWLESSHTDAFISKLKNMSSNNQLTSRSDIDPVLEQFSISDDSFDEFYAVNTSDDNRVDLAEVDVETIRSTLREDFFAGQFDGVAQRIVDRRNNRGLFQSIDEVLSIPAMDVVDEPILKQAELGPFVLISNEMVSPAIGAHLILYAALAILLSLFGILIYLYFRFHFTYSVGAVIAIVHDVFITVGLLTLLGISMDVPVVAAVLTVMGYSLNDTIVNFDRVRENRVLMGYKSSWYEVINRSVREVLNRTFVTSITTFIAVLVLYLFGGIALRGFSITLLIGVVLGTFSSIYVSNLSLFLLQTSTEQTEA